MTKRIGENHRITTDEDGITVDVLGDDFSVNLSDDNQSENENSDNSPAGEAQTSDNASLGNVPDAPNDTSSENGMPDTSGDDVSKENGSSSAGDVGAANDVVIPEQSTKQKENPPQNGKEKPQKSDKETKKTAGILILKKAATYSGCGLKFTKNVPTTVANKTIYGKLLATGLFVKG